jgi:acyl CoA:acetate/3-ketoacid CoA transferase beta subunit
MNSLSLVVPGMAAAMDLVTCAKRVLSYCSIRQAENRSTSASTVDLVESELAVFEFARDRATEIASGFAGANNLEIEIILSQVSREFYSRIL